MRLALVTEIPAPYRIPLWNALARVGDVDLRVLLLAERDPRRAYDVCREDWGFPATVLPSRQLLVGGRWLVFSRRVGRGLAAVDPEVVIVGGWNQPAFLQAVAVARRRGTPYVVWVESTSRDARPRMVLLERLKRVILASAAAVVVPGRAAAEYVRSLGVDEARVVEAPNGFDLRTFSARVEAARARREQQRAADSSPCRFLTVSRLSREKGVDVLVRAFAGVPAELTVVGDGPQEHELKRLAPPNVRFVGRVEPERLADWYANADAFALASRSETWGMVVSEAAAAGLPIVVTEAVGAGWDLVEDGVNGFRVANGDDEALRRTLTTIATDRELRTAAGARSRELVAGATPDAWADAVASLARRLLA